MFKLTLTPSFCNAWPEIQIVVNGNILFHALVDKAQTVSVNFEFLPENKILIKYLNKRNGPDVWDTKINETGEIVEDQNCIISDICIAGSRCDFLIPDLKYFQKSGVIETMTNGFMSQQGWYEIIFPKDVYSWIVDIRNNKIREHYVSKGESSLAYFESYTMNNHQNLDHLLSKIDALLNELDHANKNFNN